MKRVTFSIPWPFTATEFRELLSYAFQVALVTYLTLYLIESLKPGYVTSFYSLDNFLWVAVATGAISSLWPAVVVDAGHQRMFTIRDVVWIGMLGLGTVAVIWYKTQSLGYLGKVIAIIGGLIVIGLSLLAYYDHDNPLT